MSKSLKRVLRIRALVEEVRRVEFEEETNRQRALDVSVERSKVEAAACRRDSFSSIQEEREEQLMEVAGYEIAAWRRGQLEAMKPAHEMRVAQARAQFLSSRRQKLEVETLLDAQMDVARSEEERRTQREMDEWFALRRTQKRRSGR